MSNSLFTDFGGVYNLMYGSLNHVHYTVIQPLHHKGKDVQHRLFYK